jgi:hypothetical protein
VQFTPETRQHRQVYFEKGGQEQSERVKFILSGQLYELLNNEVDSFE